MILACVEFDLVTFRTRSERKVAFSVFLFSINNLVLGRNSFELAGLLRRCHDTCFGELEFVVLALGMLE